MAPGRTKKSKAPSRRNTARARKAGGTNGEPEAGGAPSAKRAARSGGGGDPASKGTARGPTTNGTGGDANAPRGPSPEEIAQEDRRSRRLQRTMDLCVALIEQTRGLTVGESIEIILEARSVALTLFPGSEAMFDLLYRPRLMRAVRERFGIEEVPDVPGEAPSGA